MIAGFLRGVFGRLEYACSGRSEVQLALPALDLGHGGQRLVHGIADLADTPASRLDQIARKARLIIKQGAKKVFGGELLMARFQRQPLGRLHDGASAVGIGLKIHIDLPLLARLERLTALNKHGAPPS